MNKKIAYFLVIILIVLDQLTKNSFEGVRNYKAAFGIDFSLNVIIIVSLAVILVCMYYLNSVKEKILVYGLILILSGSVGNIIDRVFLGYVRDFIEISVIPVFNLADIFNLSGVILLLLYLVQDSLRKH